MGITETESDDVILMPIMTILLNLGFTGAIIFLITKDLILTGVSAGIFSILTGIIVYNLKNRLESEPTDFKIFQDKEATIEIPFSNTQIGKISIIISEEREELPARAFDPNDPPFLKGDKVKIKKYDGGIAEIVKSVNWEIRKLKKERNKKE